MVCGTVADGETPKLRQLLGKPQQKKNVEALNQKRKRRSCSLGSQESSSVRREASPGGSESRPGALVVMCLTRIVLHSDALACSRDNSAPSKLSRRVLPTMVNRHCLEASYRRYSSDPPPAGRVPLAPSERGTVSMWDGTPTAPRNCYYACQRCSCCGRPRARCSGCCSRSRRAPRANLRSAPGTLGTWAGL